MISHSHLLRLTVLASGSIIAISACTRTSTPAAVIPPTGFQKAPAPKSEEQAAKGDLASRDATDLSVSSGGQEITVPTISVSDRGENAVQLSIDASPNQELVFEGDFLVPTPVMCGVLVIVDLIEARQVGGAEVTRVVKHIDGLATKGDVEKGKLKYAVMLNAPEIPGEYKVELRFLHAQTSSDMFLGAAGVTKVK